MKKSTRIGIADKNPRANRIPTSPFPDSEYEKARTIIALSGSATKSPDNSGRFIASQEQKVTTEAAMDIL